MFYIIRCDCGTDIKGQDEEDVVTRCIEHARDGHALTVTREQVRPLIEVVPQ